MKKNSVCKGCEDRHVGCHGKCERYIAETEEIRKEKDAVWKTQDIDRAITALGIERTRRAKGVKK